jgi:transposase
MLRFSFTTNKKGMQHMSIILNYFDENLKQFLKKKITPQVLTRLAIVLLYLLGIKRSEITCVLKCCEKTVHETLKKYKLHGLIDILEKPRSGRKSLLNIAESSKIKEEVIIKNSHFSQDKVVHIEIINDMVEKCKGKRYSLSGVYSYCKKIGLRKVKPRPVHTKNDPKIMQEWQENFTKIIETIKNKYPNKKVDVYFQDETRYGQKTITTGVWSPQEIRPEYKNQNSFLNSWIFGAINIETGKRHGLVLPSLNSENMQLFLNSFSSAYSAESGKLFVVARDNPRVGIAIKDKLGSN